MKKGVILGLLGMGAVSCNTTQPSITIYQKGKCYYNDGEKSMVEIRETKHLNKVITTYTTTPTEVGRECIVVKKLK